MTDVNEDCVVCRYYERDDRGLLLVPDPKSEKIRDIFVKSKERCDYGEGQFKALYEYMESLESLDNLRYHNHCRKKVVHKGHISRAKRKSTDSSTTSTKKRGRPSKTDSGATRVSRIYICKQTDKQSTSQRRTRGTEGWSILHFLLDCLC